MTVVKTLWIRHTFKNVTSLLIFFHRYVGRRNYTAWISRTATNIKQLHTVLVRHELYVFEDFFFLFEPKRYRGPKTEGRTKSGRLNSFVYDSEPFSHRVDLLLFF